MLMKQKHQNTPASLCISKIWSCLFNVNYNNGIETRMNVIGYLHFNISLCARRVQRSSL